MKFLILEDNPSMAKNAAARLKQLYGPQSEITITRALSEFGQLIETRHYDVLVLDLNVLDAKAPQVASAIYDMPLQLSAKVVIHTSENWNIRAQLGLDGLPWIPKGASGFEWKSAIGRLPGSLKESSSNLRLF